jgi:NTE family protein
MDEATGSHARTSPSTQKRPHTALVLGGGGITGIAWMLGILKGLRDAGLDLTTADTVIGTSAGSVVGAQITSGHDLDELYAGQLRPPDSEIGAEMRLGDLVEMVLPALAPGSPRTRRRRVGAAAMRAHPQGGHERIRVIRERIDVTEWPERDLRVTAVNAETGEFVVWHRDCDVDIVHAVASSCAVPIIWPAVSIDDTAYIDGGMRSPANADLAHFADRVVVLAPIPRAVNPVGAVRRQMPRLPASSALVVPDKAATRDFGRNVLDPAKRADAARAGLRQSPDVLARVHAAWG